MDIYISKELLTLGSKVIINSFINVFKKVSFQNKLKSAVSKNVVVNKIISKKQILHLNKTIKNSTGSFLKKVISDEFRSIIKPYDEDETIFDLLFPDFWSSLLALIEEEDSNLYQQYILSDIRNEVLNVSEKLDSINKKITNKSNSVSLRTINEINEELDKKSSKNLSIDCFELDDFKAEEKLNSAIQNKKTLFLKFYSQNEALYRVLNFLKKKGCDNTIVVESINSWNSLKESNIQDCVIVVAFAFDEIPYLPNNVNIILIDDFTCPVEYECVELKKRTATNLRGSLEQLGYKYEEITKLLNDTNGLFVPLYSKICDNSIIAFKYKIEDSDISVLSSLLFVKAFSESSFNSICDSFDFNSKELASVISRYTRGENPLLYKNSRGEIKFAAYEYAWNTLSKYVFKETVYKAFVLLIKLSQRFTNENLNICKNILNCFGYCKFVLSDSNLSFFIDDLFINMFKKIEIDQIIYPINELTDIEPKLVLEKIENTLSNKEKTIELMNDFSNSRCKILWSLEQCIQIPSLSERALEILCKLNELNLREYGNSPQNTLKDAFCPWFNVFPDDVRDNKLRFATTLINKYPKFWDILFVNFPQKGQIIFGNYYPLSFLGTKIDNSVQMDKYFRDVEGYFDICLSKSMNNVSKLIKLLNEINHFSREKANLFLKTVTSQIKSFSDLEKMQIKEAVREIIYKHRFFSDAEWAMSEKELVFYIDLLNKIIFSNEVYDYHYLYSNYSELALLNPVPFESECYHEKNELLIDELRLNKLIEFKDKNLDLDLLMGLCVEQSTILGTYIAKVYCYPQKNNEIIIKTFEADNFDIARTLCLELIGNNIEELIYLNSLYVSSKKYNTNNHSVVLSCYHNLNNEIMSLIYSQNKEVQNIYFASRALIFSETENDPVLVKKLLDSTLEYKHVNNFIEYLYEGRQSLSLEEIFNYMSSLVDQLPNFTLGVMDDYYISEVSKMLVDYVGTNKNRLFTMSQIEETFSRGDEKRQYFLNNYASIYPDYILNILLILFSKIEGDKTKAYTKLFYLNFCPGFINNSFDHQTFDSWIKGFMEVTKKYDIQDDSVRFLGKMFAFSLPDTDGIIPFKYIRQFIENENNDELNKEFVIAVLNKRGVFTPDQGITERSLANRFLEISNILKQDYPVCSKIYKWISDDYFGKSDFERKIDEL